MNMYVGYITALTYYRGIKDPCEILSAPKAAGPLDKCPGHADDSAAISMSEFEFDSRPAHVLVPSPQHRCQLGRFSYHVSSKDFPYGSFLFVDAKHLLASPELLFMQISELTASSCHSFAMSAVPSQIQLIELGCELCATYSKAQRMGDDAFLRNSPMTSTLQIAQFLEDAKGLPGCRAALATLRYVADKLNSPMETFFYLRWHLPNRLGGLNLPMPLINHEILLSEDARRILQWPTIRPDFFFPKHNLAIEINGSMHNGEASWRKDAQRKLALLAMGIQTEVITYDQLRDSRLFALAAKAICKLYAIPYRPPRTSRLFAQDLLTDALFGQNSRIWDEMTRLKRRPEEASQSCWPTSSRAGHAWR